MFPSVWVLVIQKKISDLHSELENEIMKDFTSKEVDILKELLPKVLETVLKKIHQK